MAREGIQTDHKFEESPFCDCSTCNEVCHFHYGADDACILERHMHQTGLGFVEASNGRVD